MADDLVTVIDDWAKARAKKLSARAAAHVTQGKPLNDPAYRAAYGEHKAYLALRSFIHSERMAERGDQ